MISYASLPGFGKATVCEASATHSPVPLRFVWHHVQPQEAGGATVAANLAQLCDSCHYSVHRLLWQMAKGLPVQRAPRRAQLVLARRGFEACTAAGTLAQVPDEG